MFNLTLYQTHRIFHPVVKVIAGCVLSVEVQEPVDAIPEERVGAHLSEVLKVVDVVYDVLLSPMGDVPCCLCQAREAACCRHHTVHCRPSSQTQLTVTRRHGGGGQ